MNLAEFRYLADENVAPAVVAYLRSLGLDVSTVSEKRLAGASDARVLESAASEYRVIVTHDGDFGRAAVAGQAAVVGIVFLRPGHIDPARTIECLQQLAAASFVAKPPFIIVAERSEQRVAIRIRHIPSEPPT